MFKVPDLVILDLDNTLYDFQQANGAGELALNDYLCSVLKLSKEDVFRFISDSRMRVKMTLGNTASSHSRLLYIRDFLRENRIYIHSTFALECEQIFWRAYLEQMFLFDGVEEFLSFLRLSKSKLVLITDLTTQIQLRKLAWLGLDKTFDLIITSEEAGGDKKTGMPEALLRSYFTPSANRTWCVGDNNWDYMFPNESTFFKKMPSGKLREIDHNKFEFSSFIELSSKIDL